ncbi:MAG: phenylalanine--tRNA ligase subunit beta [Actinobacteria bacterium]|nr:phenylalanine--tRNA ligase subunit beta [Actinomycetota bacterium]
MRVSLEWLSDYVEYSMPPGKLADLLSLSGTAVDRVIEMGAETTGVVVGEVLEVKDHPNADKLKIAVVYDGFENHEIVCGAPNLFVGMKSAFARVGASFSGLSGGKLKGAKIRGIASDGMLCSGAELGINDDASGILELGEGTPPGTNLSDIAPTRDVIFDLEITPNRPDCMSMLGVAREVAALTGARLVPPSYECNESGSPAGDLAKVIIEDLEGCPRYSARVMTGIEIGPSPLWMQRRLVAAGLRPINNVVDITNYVLIELGQPLHAFDLDLLAENTIVVRKADFGEQITTLDGVERQLDDKTLVIADRKRPVALAGIMGGEDSEVSGDSTRILIESAHFDPTSIYLTSKRLGIRSESSSRFERGSDPEAAPHGAARAARLMNQLAGGTISRGEIDVYPRRTVPVTIDLRPSRANEILGTRMTTDEMAGILEGLEIAVEKGEKLRTTVPSFRWDLEREIDLIEEIGRIYGLDKIEEAIPVGGGLNAGLTRKQKLIGSIDDTLLAQGLSEVVVYSFMNESDLDLLRIPSYNPMRRALPVINPLTETGGVMRTTLLPGMLNTALRNTNRGNRDIAIFERGRVFLSNDPGELPEEIEVVGILLAGVRGLKNWSVETNENYDFFDLKGIMENISDVLGVSVSYKPEDRAYLAPGRSAGMFIDGDMVGVIGQLHPEIAGSYGLDGEYYFGEFMTGPLVEASRENTYKKVGRFPNVKVDIALIVEETLPASTVLEKLTDLGAELLVSARLFDVYQGNQIPGGKKSLAFALEFGSADGTLTDEQAHGELERIIKEMENGLGAELRGRINL